MSVQRKKVDPKPINKVEPKKRVETEKTTQKKKVEKKPVVKQTEEPKTKEKRSENKFVRIEMGASQVERKAISDRVHAGELKLSHYATENDKGYHYYLVIKK
jgi:hypothetical protein